MDLQNQFWNDFYTYPFHLFETQMGKFCFPNKRWRNPFYSNSLFSHFKKRFKLLQYNPLLIFFIHILVFCFQSVSSQSWDGIIVTQSNYQSLQAIKHELIDPKGVLWSWNDTGYGACSGKWAGIKCAKGQVIVIQLPWRGLGGRISEHIGELTSLRKLSLHDNSIGGMVPTSLGFLPNLRGVQLFNNRFAGWIPASIGSCPLLQNLDLSNNSLTGAIPTSLANSSRLYRLNLSFNALSGLIPIGLTRSHSLTLLSLQYNNLSGSLSNTWGEAKRKHLYQLKSLTLDHNFISGSIPVSLSELDMLEELSLSNNQMSGIIPSELGTLSRLRRLDLSNNAITGDIPPSLVDLTNLTSFNASYNKLSGSVPFVLSRKFDSSSFEGNVDLCGYSVSTPCPSPPPSPNSSQTLPPSTSEISTPRRHRLSTKGIIMIVSGAILALLLLLCCLLVCCLIRKKASSKATMGRTPTTREKGAPAMEGEVEAGGETGGKLVHFDGPLVFTADDLLCATAEIMGKSTYGTVYKATLEDGSEVAVKRLREKITKNQREFEVEVNLLGKIRHDNLLALRAYYLGPKGEKLLVFDYMPRGSLAAFLHARGPDTLIDWPTRMNIIVGVARGLNYIHTNENMVHGNLTAANILLDEQTNPKISDYGLSKLMTTTPNTNVVATAAALGYRAPELPKLKKANTNTDVYSLGVIMLELLTGKSPDEVMDGVDLPQWVASIVKEEWTNEVFDLELMRDAATTTTGDELLNTLKLALHCVDPSPAARPEVQQILNQLEEIKPEVGVSFGDDVAGDSTGAPSSNAD